MHFRTPLVAFAMILATAATAQDKRITFDNSTPPKTVNLVNGATLSISPDGNVTARCVLDANNNCADAAGSGGSPPTVSLAASGFSNPADGNQQYPALTTFTLTPTVSANSEVCIRQTEPGTPSISNWPAGSAIVSPGAALVQLPSISTTYGFKLRCFSAGGASTSQVLSVVTNSQTGGGGGADQCNAAAVVPPATPPAGYNRLSSPTQFTQLRTISTAFCSDFPNTGGGECRLLSSTANYVSIRFQVPANINTVTGLQKRFSWESAQQAQVDPGQYYVSVTQCPGDFRFPPVSTTPASTDPTFAPGCRNFRDFPPSGAGNFGAINYHTDGSASNNNSCALDPDKVYYFNLILASPEGGGITPGEHTCTNGLATCGIQMVAQ